LWGTKKNCHGVTVLMGWRRGFDQHWLNVTSGKHIRAGRKKVRRKKTRPRGVNTSPKGTVSTSSVWRGSSKAEGSVNLRSAFVEELAMTLPLVNAQAAEKNDEATTSESKAGRSGWANH